MDNPIPIPFRFGGEKGRKQPRRLVGVDSRTGIGDGHQNLAGLRKLRLNHQLPGLVFKTGHRLGAIDRKVQNHLLQLNPIAEYGWENSRQVPCFSETPFSLHIASDQVKRFR